MRILITVIISLLLTGCGLFDICPEQKEYLKPDFPELSEYPIPDDYQFGELYNRVDTVCVVKWNACIPKDEFMNLVVYIKKHKSQLESSNQQSKDYNLMIQKLKEKHE